MKRKEIHLTFDEFQQYQETFGKVTDNDLPGKTIKEMEEGVIISWNEPDPEDDLFDFDEESELESLEVESENILLTTTSQTTTESLEEEIIQDGLTNEQLMDMVHATTTIVAKDEVDATIQGDAIDDERAFKVYRLAFQKLQQQFTKKYYHLVVHDTSALTSEELEERKRFEETLALVKENSTESINKINANDLKFLINNMNIKLDKKEIYDIYGLSPKSHNNYKTFVDSMERFVHNAVYKVDTGIIATISELKPMPGEDYIVITPYWKMAPYTLAPSVLNQPWGKINLTVQKKLHSVAAIRLYSKSDYQLRYYYSLKTGKAKKPQTVKQRDLLLHPTWTYKGLREFTGVQGKKRRGKQIYQRASDFNTKVVKKAVADINENTNIEISYITERDRNGYGSIKAYVFTIAYKPSYLDLYLSELEGNNSGAAVNYKEDDPIAALSLEERKETKDKALLSKYTPLLVQTELLTTHDIFKEDVLMSNLYLKVYPRYETLEQDLGQGIEGVIRHLEYVRSHMVGIQSRHVNLAGYLQKAIDHYIMKVKIEQID